MYIVHGLRLYPLFAIFYQIPGHSFMSFDNFSLWLTLLSTTFPVVILGDFNIFICPFQTWACNFLDSSNSTILSSDLLSCTCKEGESMGFGQKVSRLLNPALLWTISWCFQSVTIYGGINSNVSAFSNGYSSKENCKSFLLFLKVKLPWGKVSLKKNQ